MTEVEIATSFAAVKPSLNEALRNEYEEVCRTVAQTATMDNKCTLGNLYSNVRPGSKCVVKFPMDGKEVTYNANQLSATQFICGSPSEIHIDAFWCMILATKINNIILMSDWTGLHKGRIVTKVTRFIPKVKKMRAGPPSVIHWTHSEPDHGIVQHSLEVDDGQERRTVRLFRFTDWPDHGVPEHFAHLKTFFDKYLTPWRRPNDVNLYMCSAGWGRSGTMALIEMMLYGGVSGKEALLHVRRTRPGAVQTLDQYCFAHAYVTYHNLTSSSHKAQSPQ